MVLLEVLNVSVYTMSEILKKKKKTVNQSEIHCT